MSTLKRGVGQVQVVHSRAGRRAQPSGRDVSTTTVVWVRWRSSSKCPFGGAAGPDDRDPIAQRLDLGEDVAGQQYGPARIAQLADDVLEDHLHQRVETGGRLVQQISSTSEANAATSATFCRLPFE